MTDTHIFAISSYQGFVLVRYDRDKPNDSKSTELFGFKPDQYECMQAYKNKVLVCFASEKSEKSLIPQYNDHHLFMYSSDLSFMQRLTFSSYAFFPPKLHTSAIVEVLQQSLPKDDQKHYQYWAFRSAKPGSARTLTKEEQAHLSIRNLQKSWRRQVSLCEMIIFPYDGDDSFLVVGLRDERNCFYLFAVHRTRLFQCDSIQKQDKDYYPGEAQFRIYPRPDLKGILSFSSAGTIENLSLVKYQVNF